MRLQNEVKGIPVSEMKDGEIGIVTSWIVGEYKGRIIQRFGDFLVALQMKSGSGFSAITDKDDCRVRILQKGEVLIIE